MDIINIALMGDLKLFSEFLDLLDISDIKPNAQEADTIFKHCIPSIQQEYYDRYKKNLMIRCSAILNSNKVEMSGFILSNSTDWKYITDPRLLTSGYIIISVKSLEYSNIYAKYITDDMIIDNDDIQAIRTTRFVHGYLENIISVISDNPKLSKYYTHELDVNFERYDFEQLSILIKNNIVTYPAEVYGSRYLLDFISNVRKYIPDWTLDNIEWADSETTLEEMDYCIRHGLIPKDKLSPYDATDEELILRNIQYLTDEAIMVAYITEGFKSLIPYLKPVYTTIYLAISSLDNIAYLNDKCLSKIDIDLDLELTDLLVDDILKLNDIINRCHYISWHRDYTLDNAILLHHYIDKFEGVDYKLKYTPNMDSILISYRKGVNLLWNKHNNEPLCNILFCRYLQNYIPSLDPPMEVKYYRFMDKSLLDKITNAKKFKSYSDISIVF